MSDAVVRLGWWSAAALVAAAFAPAVAPFDSSLAPPAEAATVGFLAALALYAVLARRAAPAALAGPGLRRRLFARSVVLTIKSAQEEALWRGLALGALVAPLGCPAALAVSTTLFAGVHVRTQGRAATVHLATGAVFGLVYLLTGRLLAPIVAHGAYNVLVGAATLAREDMSLTDTGAGRGRVVPSLRPHGLRIPSTAEGSMPPAFPQVVARLDGVEKSFGGVRALDGIDLDLGAGEIVALLGPNGAGKSTAVAVMLGLRRPDAGRAFLAGLDPTKPEARRHVGAVLQEIGFPQTLRVDELAALVRAHFPDAQSAEETLGRLDLAHVARRQALGLSGGQRRRLAVALALAGRPRVLFLDEPTAGMDANARRALLRDLETFAAHGGSVLLTTQQLSEAEEIASRVALLVGGRIVLDGTVAEVRARAGLTRVTLRARVLPPLAGVSTVHSLHDRHVVYVGDADRFVVDLVGSGVEFRDLEVAPVSLEDAFVTLTDDAGAVAGGSGR
ncbi:MAG TPA: ATP-binding cassette domain-containing protein [Gaiella sp.]|nr:ATP-binding cassette domain-containing protein [Gaiella sp.]